MLDGHKKAGVMGLQMVNEKSVLSQRESKIGHISFVISHLPFEADDSSGTNIFKIVNEKCQMIYDQ